jgi:hypothetical protein
MKSNPTSGQQQAETVALVGAASGAVASVAGAPRLGGSLVLASGLYNLYEGRRLVGGSFVLGGLAMLFFPEIQKALSSKPSALPKKPDESNKVPVYYAGFFDEDIGGGWTLLDAREARTQAIDPDKDAHVGMQAALLLQQKGAPPKVFKAKIIGNSGDDYDGSWVGGAPANGPQMISFRGANIWALFPG